MFAWVREQGGTVSPEVEQQVDAIAASGGTPLAVANGPRVLGVIFLKDIIKEGIAERFAELRRMGIRTVMITGDNPATAHAIAAEAGVDDDAGRGNPEDKMELIKRSKREDDSSR